MIYTVDLDILMNQSTASEQSDLLLARKFTTCSTKYVIFSFHIFNKSELCLDLVEVPKLPQNKGTLSVW